jgi:transposase InsO family protein
MQPVNERYETVRRLSSSYGINALCEALEISRSGYYAWLDRKPGKRTLEDAAIRREILRSHYASPTYGADNIHADVRERMVCGRNRIRRLMGEMGVRSLRKRRYKATTNSRHGYSASPDLLKSTAVSGPNQVWVSDVTYILTGEGWLYLAIVKDLFTREVTGYATGDRITSGLTESALITAVMRRHPPRGLICHSDRGVQYCCASYLELLKRHGFVSSMSRKGNPYDNAVAENFFSCIKCEMVYLNTFETRRDASLAVFRYIDGFYNRRRRHESLGRISPYEFRRRWEAEADEVGSRWRVPCSGGGARGQGFKRSGP